MPSIRYAFLFLLVLASGCAQELESPTPATSGLDPNLVCGEQLVTAVTVSGSGLSPVVVDALTDDPGLALPQLSLQKTQDLDGGGDGGDPVVLDDTAGEHHVRWIDDATMEFDIYPELDLESGGYDFFAANADGQTAAFTDGFAVVPAPPLDAIEPQILCVDQEDQLLALTGTTFIEVDGQLPTVTIGDHLTLTVDELDGCVEVAAADFRYCTDATVTVPQATLDPGVYDVTLTNPDPASCTSTESIQIEIVPPPALEEVDPNLVCTAQFDNELTLTGSGFLILDGVLPTVDIGASYSAEADAAAGCELLLGPAGGETCTELTFTIPVGTVEAGSYAVVVTNPAPADCYSSEEVAIEVVPPPTLEEIDPEIVCVDQADQPMVLTGTGFLDIDGARPTVTVGAVDYIADSVSDCVDLATANVQSCNQLTVTLTMGSLQPGTYGVFVTNAEPANCQSTETLDIEVVPPPTLSGAAPELMCNEQSDNELVLTGSGFLVLDGVLPTVSIGVDYSAEADAANDCLPLTGYLNGETCNELVFTVPMGMVSAAVHAVTVINPSPAGCSTAGATEIEVVPPPELTALYPTEMCVDAPDVLLTLEGSGLLLLGADCSDPANCPTVTIDGVDYVPLALDGCSPLAGPAGGEACTSLDIEILTGTFPAAGSYPVDVTNPAPADCVADVSVTLGVVDPPTITGIVPDLLCDDGGDFSVMGTGFQPGAEVYLDQIPATTVTWVNDTQLDVTFAMILTPGFYDVTVVNPDGCEVTYPAGMEVVPGPSMYFIDPPVIYSEITTTISLYVGGVTGTITDVWIEEVATTTVHIITNFVYDGAGTILAEIPAGALNLPEGEYTVYVEDDTNCPSMLENSLYVEEDLELAVTGIEPSFGWEQEDTPVDIWAAEAGDLQAGEVQFTDLPRVYLNPSSGLAATGLVSVSYKDATWLSAVVPEGLPADVYDVIVVNPAPGNEIGVLFGAFTITVDPPPVIDSVSPTRTDASTATPVVINGSDFRNPTVDLDCLEPNQSTTNLAATITAFSGTSIDAVVPSDTLAAGTVCVVRVTNDDGSYYDYSAISVGSPSGNLFSWAAGPDMVVARRAPAAVAGRATERSRYLYAIGGDDGDAGGAMASVEVVQLDAYGNLGSWEMLPGELPEPRTLAGVAQVGRFIFVVGGNDGFGPVDSVLRTQILDPLAAPPFDAMSLDYGGGNGLDGGTWTYRISAVFDAADPINPGGESMASDPVVAILPTVPDMIHTTISWEKVVDAIGYNIYRSPYANSGSGTEELLDYVPDDGIPQNLTQQFTDVGDPTTAGYVPLPDGSLGEWAEVSQLPGLDADDAARESPAVAVGWDPVYPTTIAYIYVAGGLDGYGAYRDTILYLDVTDDGESLGSWSTSANLLVDGRSRAGGFTVDETYHSIVGQGESWIYVGPGLTSTGTSTATEAGEVLGGGELGWAGNVDNFTPGRDGYAYLSANNYLYIIGGERGASLAADDGKEAEITGPPSLGGWNSLGGSRLTEPRGLPGSAIESAVVFAIGGVDDNGQALATTDYTNF